MPKGKKKIKKDEDIYLTKSFKPLPKSSIIKTIISKFLFLILMVLTVFISILIITKTIKYYKKFSDPINIVNKRIKDIKIKYLKLIDKHYISLDYTTLDKNNSSNNLNIFINYHNKNKYKIGLKYDNNNISLLNNNKYYLIQDNKYYNYPNKISINKLKKIIKSSKKKISKDTILIKNKKISVQKVTYQLQKKDIQKLSKDIKKLYLNFYLKDNKVVGIDIEINGFTKIYYYSYQNNLSFYFNATYFDSLFNTNLLKEDLIIEGTGSKDNDIVLDVSINGQQSSNIIISNDNNIIKTNFTLKYKNKDYQVDANYQKNKSIISITNNDKIKKIEYTRTSKKELPIIPKEISKDNYKEVLSKYLKNISQTNNKNIINIITKIIKGI